MASRVQKCRLDFSKWEAFSLIQIPGAKVERYSPKYVCTYVHTSDQLYIHETAAGIFRTLAPWRKQKVCTILLFIYSKYERTKHLA